jgi:ribosome-associated protein YbcJ (S4-like RNA binding protein)
MRLDFDHDGSVSLEDLKKSMVGLYDFLKNFDVIQTTTQIKGKLYTDAIAYMQNELEEDKKQKERHVQEKLMIENDAEPEIKEKTE